MARVKFEGTQKVPHTPVFITMNGVHESDMTRYVSSEHDAFMNRISLRIMHQKCNLSKSIMSMLLKNKKAALKSMWLCYSKRFIKQECIDIEELECLEKYGRKFMSLRDRI